MKDLLLDLLAWLTDGVFFGETFKFLSVFLCVAERGV